MSTMACVEHLAPKLVAKDDRSKEVGRKQLMESNN